MALPTPQKTWVIDPCNRVVFSSLVQTQRTIAYENKVFLKANGFTVKGSSTGSVAAMDAVDRWAAATDAGTRGANTTTAQSWIVLEHSGMGGLEILMTYQGSADNNYKIAISPGGNWTVAATATHQPTASDEVIVIANTIDFINSTASGDRLWSGWVSSDGAICRLAIARAGAWVNGFAIESVSSTVNTSGGAGFSPAVLGVLLGTGSAFQPYSTRNNAAVANAGGVGRANGIGQATTQVTGMMGVEGYNGTSGPANTTFVPELQGSALLYPLTVWSNTATARGKLGLLYDWWVGLTTAGDGDTYPNDATRLFIQLNDDVWPWDGSAISMT